MTTREQMLECLRSNGVWGTWHTAGGSTYHTFTRRCRNEAGERSSRLCEHQNRQAIAAGFRRLGQVFGIVTEHLARQPERFVCPDDAREWKTIKDRTWRSSHGTGEAARASYHRACWRLWNWICGIARMGHDTTYRGCPRLEW